jgi:hypothetical protein
MEFKEIFKNDGLYAAEGFAKGFCFEIINGTLYGLQYESTNDLMPEREIFATHLSLFTKKYRQVLTIKSLF